MAGYALEEVREVNDDATRMVNERFNLAEQLAGDQVDAAQVYLESLSSLFANAVMPSSDISYDFQDIALDSDIRSDRPESPTDEELTIPDIPDPVMGVLNPITVPTITIPTYELAEPDVTELVYDEAVYDSDLQVALKTVLIAFIENGGTGLGEDVEAALWARGRAKQDILNERTYNEASEFFASRGYTIPPGALGGRLAEALVERTRADAQLNFEILIEQARLARAQSEYSMQAALTLEGQDKEQFNNIANRALDYAKSAVQVIIDLYTAKVQAFVAKSESTKLIVESERMKVDAAVAANAGVIDAYTADIEGFKAKLSAELGIVEMVAKVYGYQIAGYEADVRAAAMLLDAQTKTYMARVEQANNQTTLTLKEAEVAIQAYLGALQLTSDSIKAGGNISAQIAAAALSAVNASASLGAHATSSYGSSSNYGRATSESWNETHYYDETAP
jgi:hypothetical protein